MELILLLILVLFVWESDALHCNTFEQFEMDGFLSNIIFLHFLCKRKRHYWFSDRLTIFRYYLFNTRAGDIRRSISPFNLRCAKKIFVELHFTLISAIAQKIIGVITHFNTHPMVQYVSVNKQAGNVSTDSWWVIVMEIKWIEKTIQSYRFKRAKTTGRAQSGAST